MLYVVYVCFISIVFFDLRLEYAYVFYKVSLEIYLNYAYVNIFSFKFACHYGKFRPSKTDCFILFHMSVDL